MGADVAHGHPDAPRQLVDRQLVVIIRCHGSM
jgi:hypothetical protein